MRWPRETTAKPGERRIVRRFLWQPHYLNDQWRWLEFARIEQMAVASPFYVQPFGTERERVIWEDQNWADVEE